VRLAVQPFVELVLGLEARPESIKRAELAAELLGRGNLEFRQADLDSDSLARFGQFDAAFCAGLLYHLRQPWRLIQEIATVTDRLFLDTHYSESGEDHVDGYVGSTHPEYGYSEPLSGLSETSFWLTLPCLIDTLSQAGFEVRHRHIIQDWAGYGPRVPLAAFKESVMQDVRAGLA
jgi:SAM-dependent methyltransferase